MGYLSIYTRGLDDTKLAFALSNENDTYLLTYTHLRNWRSNLLILIPSF